MRVSRSSLCNLLLEDGEEDLAVLVARADLPHVLDTDRDGAALTALGLGAEELAALLPARDAVEVASPDDVRDAAVRRTISGRWAELVASWTGPAGAGTAAGDRRGES